jgi:hypothetical protein
VSSTSSTALDITAMATIQRWTFAAGGDSEDTASMEELEWEADGVVGPDEPVPEAVFRLETDIPVSARQVS